ncbi:MAG: hypothetical protein ABJL67_02705 [Sulfitobacter sp.]
MAGHPDGVVFMLDGSAQVTFPMDCPSWASDPLGIAVSGAGEGLFRHWPCG